MLFNTKNLSYMFTETNLVTNQRLNNLCSLFNQITRIPQYLTVCDFVLFDHHFRADIECRSHSTCEIAVT